MSKKNGQQASDDFMDFVNNMSLDKQGFVDGVMNSHRTLQQSAFGVMMECIKAWSDMYENNRYDLRNEDTVKLCNQIYNQYKDDWYVRFV